MAWLLLAAAGISLVVGDLADSLAVLAILLLNAILGFFQEYRAERAAAALRKLASPTVRVERDGSVKILPAEELVPGDLVRLEAGDLVPADIQLWETADLRIDESAITGEAFPVTKQSAWDAEEKSELEDGEGRIFLGTLVLHGRAKGVVQETGMHTRLGRISSLLRTVHRAPTPLQIQLGHLGTVLLRAALAVVFVVSLTELLRGRDLRDILMTSISMAVAAVPEGLPAVMTVSLAIGAQRMLRRRALIRKLPAVEALGSVTVICSDKTGTLTENRMTVTVLDVAGHRMDLKTEHPPEPPTTGGGADRALRLLLLGATLCNDADLDAAGAEEAGTGDPTELALLRAASSFGLKKSDCEANYPRVAEAPFDSERKRMATVHSLPADASVLQWIAPLGTSAFIVFAKGAMESLLDRCSGVLYENMVQPIDTAWKTRIRASHDRIAAQGMRVLAIACRLVGEAEAAGGALELEQNLVFVGMAGIHDPPRGGVRESVERCQQAGIRPVMITGDHPLTADSIAGTLNIGRRGSYFTGRDLERLSPEELEKVAAEVAVYARVSPEHKLKLVEALQRNGDVVAMTGDGVNDALALKKADIGVAMGRGGTEVAREAADVVLTDDNFNTIVAAVEEGRVIYGNLRKFVLYIVTSNAAELWVMLLGPLVGLPAPLLPLQILWINLVTDGLPGLGLTMEPAERDVMRRPPRKPGERILDRKMGISVLWTGFFMAAISLGAGLLFVPQGEAVWRTVLFTVLTLAQLAHVTAIRTGDHSFFRGGYFANLPLFFTVMATFAIQAAILYWPLAGNMLKVVPLPWTDLLLCAALSSLVFWAIEAEKAVRRRFKR